MTREIRSKVHKATGLTCSAGIAPTPMLAKICSDLNKPDGQYFLAGNVDAVVDFVRECPIRSVPVG